MRQEPRRGGTSLARWSSYIATPMTGSVGGRKVPMTEMRLSPVVGLELLRGRVCRCRRAGHLSPSRGRLSGLSLKNICLVYYPRADVNLT